MTSVTTPTPRRVRRPLTSTGIVFVVLVLTIIAGAVLTASAGRNFFSPGNVTAVLTGTSILGFVAIGQTLVILGGSLDLSVPYVVSLTSLVAGVTMAGEASNVPLAIVLALGVAAVIGLLNGLVVSLLDVHGFIATLGMGLVLAGYLGTTYKGSEGSAPRAFRLIGATTIGPVPVSVLIMLGCAALVILVLRRTRIGHHLYAVGGNPQVARLSGLRTAPPIILAHVLCSVLSGMAGLLLLAGGKGNVLGTLGGIAIFAVMDNVMSVLEVNAFLKDVVRGLVIVLAVAVYARRNADRRPERFGRRGSGARVTEEVA